MLPRHPRRKNGALTYRLIRTMRLLDGLAWPQVQVRHAMGVEAVHFGQTHALNSRIFLSGNEDNAERRNGGRRGINGCIGISGESSRTKAPAVLSVTDVGVDGGFSGERNSSGMVGESGDEARTRLFRSAENSEKKVQRL